MQPSHNFCPFPTKRQNLQNQSCDGVGGDRAKDAGVCGGITFRATLTSPVLSSPAFCECLDTKGAPRPPLCPALVDQVSAQYCNSFLVLRREGCKNPETMGRVSRLGWGTGLINRARQELLTFDSAAPADSQACSRAQDPFPALCAQLRECSLHLCWLEFCSVASSTKFLQSPLVAFMEQLPRPEVFLTMS